MAHAATPGQAAADARRRLVVVVAVFAVVLLSLVFRVRAVQGTIVISPLQSDAGQYFIYAYNLRHHGVYSRDRSAYFGQQASPEPDAVRSPGYPLFLTAFVDGKDINPIVRRIKVAQVVVSVLVVLLIYLIARRFLGTAPALLAALLTGLSPHLINANVYLLTESLFAFCLALLFWVFARYVDSGRLWILLLVGILIGFGSLVRPALQYFVVPMILLVGYHAGGGRRLKAAGLIILGFLLVFSPWVIRNLHTLDMASDQVLMISTLHHGAYPGFMYRDDESSLGFPYKADPNSEAIGESMDSVLAEIRRRFAEEPGRHLQWYLLEKPVMLWSWDMLQGGFQSAFFYPVRESPYIRATFMNRSHLLMRHLHWPLVVLAALAAVAVWLPASVHRLDRRGRFVAQGFSLLCVYVTALHIVGAPFPRYSIPLRPMVYAMAVLGFVLLCRHLATWFRAIGAKGTDYMRSREDGQKQAFEHSSPLNG